MRVWITILAVLATLSFSVGTAQAKAKKKDKALSGTIVSVAADGGSLVLEAKGKKGAATGQKTITINASTSIEINNQPGKKASDLKSGMTAKITVTDGAASDIVVGKKKKKK